MRREDCKIGDIVAIPDDHGKPRFFRVTELRESGPLMIPVTKREARAEMENLAQAKRLSQLCGASVLTIQ